MTAKAERIRQAIELAGLIREGPEGKVGKAGLDGMIGPMGPDGPVGPKGDKGDKGDTGPAGPKGDTGKPGLPGMNGLPGLKGDTGPQGPAAPTAWPVRQGTYAAARGGPSTDLGWFNVKTYGAKGDGTTDDTAAIQAALTAAAVGAKAGTVYFPAGVYIVSSELTVNISVTMLGANRASSRLQTTSTNINMIRVNADHVRITGLELFRAGTAAASGSAIYLESGLYAQIDDCLIFGSTATSGWYDNIATKDAYLWAVDRCVIIGPVRYGVWVRNTALPDRGDSTIISTTFTTATTSSAGVRVESSGGLRIENCKFLNSTYGVDLQVADGVTTSDLFVVGCSLEAQTTAAIRLGRSGTTGIWSQIVITGNQMYQSAADGILYAAGAYTANINGNIMVGVAGHVGIDIQANVNSMGVTDNFFDSWGTAIRTSTTSIYITIGQNTFRSVPVPVEDNIPANGFALPIQHFYRATVQNITSAVTYTNVFQIDMSTYRGVRMELAVEGLLGGVGSVARSYIAVIKRDAGNCALTVVTDTSAAAAIDLQFDVATTAGSVIIGIRRNGAGGGSQFDGPLSLNLVGHVYKIHLL